jgi:hypothetical protein
MSTTEPGPSRPRPVLLYGIAFAALQALTLVPGFDDHVGAAGWWIRTAVAVGTAVGAVLTQRQTTPLSDPVDRDGTPLVRLPDARSATAVDAIDGDGGGGGADTVSWPGTSRRVFPPEVDEERRRPGDTR